MRNLKKVLALVLALVMSLSLVTIANAANFSDQDDIQYTEAVDVLTALGVIEGVGNNTFRPEGNVTRAQMAKMITIISLGNVDPSSFLGTTTDLKDINGHWAEAYIKYCYSQGIISGKGNGIFDPDANVTSAEASKMLLTAIGYNSDVQGYTGSQWTINVTRDAQTSGFYKDLAVPANQALTRDQASQMIYNAVDADLIVATPNWNASTGTVTYTYEKNKDGDDLLSETFEAVVEYGYMTNAEYDIDKAEYTYTFATSSSFGADAISSSSALKQTTLTTELDASALYGQQVKVVYKNNAKDDYPVYGIYANKSTVLASGVVGDLPDDLAGSDTSMKIDGTTYRFETNAAGTDLYANLNGSMSDNMAGLTGVALEYGFKLIDNDGNDKVNCVVIYPFAVAKVSYVGTDSFNISANTIMGVNTAVTGIKFEDVTVYDGIAKNDYVMIIDERNAVDGQDNYIKIDNIVEGKVTSTKTDAAEVNGEWYSYDSNNTTYALGSTYKFVIVNGYICASETVTTGADVSDYAVVTKAEAAAGVRDDQVELLFTDGTKKIVAAAANYTSGWIGELVTFEIKDGEYELTKASTLSDGTNGTSGFDVKLSSTTYNYVSGGKSTLGGEFIADDAVVFVKDSANKYDVISGAALKRYSNGVTGVIGFADKASNGFNNVVLAYVNLAGTVAKATENYGYVTSGLTTTKNEDNETVSKLSMWTADGQLTDILADSNLSGEVSKGSVVTYDINDDGSYTIDLANVNRAAVLAYNSANGTIRFTDGTLNSTGTNVNLEVTSDTVILGINSDTNKGVEGAEIATAVETATDNLYQANAYYFSSNGTELDVIVIDVYADLPTMAGSFTSDATTQEALQAELYSNTNVTFNADNLASAATVTVPKGVTLKVTDVDASSKLTVTVADGATLDISALAADAEASQLEATVKPGATFIYDNGTLVGSTGYLTSTGDITVKNAADNTLDVTLTGTVTLKKDLVIGAGDEITATGATIVGNAAGRSIVVRDESKITGQDSSNFFENGSDASADAVSNGTYVWTADVCTTDGATVTPGWLKQA